LIRQGELYGTAPDAYGDLVLAINPPEPAKPPIFKRLATSHTEAGGLPSPTQASTGDNLELAELDADLVVTLANGRYLLVGNPSAEAVAIFEIQTMRRVAMV
jgi:hypothetical protein